LSPKITPTCTRSFHHLALVHAELNRDRGERFFHCLGGGCESSGDQVTVDVQRDRRLGMSQDLAYREDGHIALEHDAGGGVAQIVKADVWKAGFLQDFFEILQQVVQIQRRTAGGRKDQVVFLLAVTHQGYLLLLGKLMVTEGIQRTLTKLDRPLAGFRLRFAEDVALSIHAL